MRRASAGSNSSSTSPASGARSGRCFAGASSGGAGWRTVRIGTIRRQARRGTHPAREVGVLEITQLPGADRRLARDHDDLLFLWNLHHFARSQQLARHLLTRDHDVHQPGREPVACIVALGAQLRRGAKRVRNTLGRALVVGGERDPDMAIVEDRIVLAIGLGDLVERLRDQKAVDAVAGLVGERFSKKSSHPSAENSSSIIRSWWQCRWSGSP